MVRQDAIFSQGAFRPVEPLMIAEGTRVHLRIEQDAAEEPVAPVAKMHTPKLARREDAGDFVMEVGESDNAGI